MLLVLVKTSCTRSNATFVHERSVFVCPAPSPDSRSPHRAMRSVTRSALCVATPDCVALSLLLLSFRPGVTTSSRAYPSRNVPRTSSETRTEDRPASPPDHPSNQPLKVHPSSPSQPFSHLTLLPTQSLANPPTQAQAAGATACRQRRERRRRQWQRRRRQQQWRQWKGSSSEPSTLARWAHDSPTLPSDCGIPMGPYGRPRVGAPHAVVTQPHRPRRLAPPTLARAVLRPLCGRTA